MMILGGTNWKYLVGLVIIAAGLAAVYLLTKGYTADRISAWLDPESDPLDKGLQILQSQYAIGSGGLTGLGFGRSRQKYMYLPEEHNDYIFAIICEELGFIGAIGILILFALLIIRGYWIAMHARDRFFHAAGRGAYHPVGDPGLSERGRGYESAAFYGYFAAVLFLGWHSADHAACRKRHYAQYFAKYFAESELRRAALEGDLYLRRHGRDISIRRWPWQSCYVTGSRTHRFSLSARWMAWRPIWFRARAFGWRP